ncbi:hypothetical protein [Acidiphilium sp. PM]|uniref:hypothetical protein n=1 Tax=Acidiphilium sp. PM TaxID=1043206 RepID=UPI00031D7983|nr:hypothetical protein [Acidiphilium sp. PM]
MSVMGDSSDNLGAWGEHTFAAMCTAAGLIANRASRDKMGWDFIVELPPDDSDSSISYDKRQNRLSCRVQIKTHLNSDKIRTDLSLSAAERLAKSLDPSFVFVLIAEEDNATHSFKLSKCYLIHIFDENLERILKSLRSHSVSEQPKSPQKKRITFDPKTSGQDISPNGKAIVDAIFSIINPSMADYRKKKQDQLENAGYADRRFRLETTITAENPDDFVEMMLGIKSTNLVKLNAYESRFGINLPIDRLNQNQIIDFKILPTPIDCEIIFFGPPGSQPARLSASLYFPAALVPKDNFRIIIKSGYLDFDFSISKGLNFNLEINSIVESNHEFIDCHNYLILLDLISNNLVQRLQIKSNNTAYQSLIFDISGHFTGFKTEWFEYLKTVSDLANKILSFAGTNGNMTSFNDLDLHAESIFFAYDCIFNPKNLPQQKLLSLNKKIENTVKSNSDILFIGRVIIAEKIIAYACSARAFLKSENDKINLYYDIIQYEDINIVNTDDDSLCDFINKIKYKTKIENSIVFNL